MNYNKPKEDNHFEIPKIENFSVAETRKLIEEEAERLGEKLATDNHHKITTTQLRKFFHELKAISEKEIDDDKLMLQLSLFKAKVAYSVTRQEDKGHRKGSKNNQKHIAAAYNVNRQEEGKEKNPFYELTKNAVQAIKNKDAFNNFLAFMEAIVGYHKFYGGRD